MVILLFRIFARYELRSGAVLRAWQLQFRSWCLLVGFLKATLGTGACLLGSRFRPSVPWCFAVSESPA